MAVYLGLFVLLILGVSSEEISWAENNLKLVIDQDAGADDAMAIYMALICEKYFYGPEIVGITISHGNVNETQAYMNTQRILSIAGRRDVPIYRGATHSIVQDEPSDHFFGLDGLGDTDVGKDFENIEAMPTEAAIALLDLSYEYEGLLQIVCLGALTNLALAVRLDPGIVDRVAHIYVAAGHIQSEAFPLPEYNADADVEAYRMVMQAAKSEKVTLIPFSVILESVNITKVWRKEVLGGIPTELMQTQNAFESIAWTFNSTTWNLLDPAAMAIVLNESLITEEKYSLNDIVLCGEQRGVNLNNFVSKEDANVNIVSRVNGTQYQQYLVDVFSQEP